VNSITDRIDITINFDTAKSDIEKLRRVFDEMSEFEIRAKDKDEGIRQLNEELQKRLIEAGLKFTIK